MKRLLDKVSLITGAASGIGKATAELFHQEGSYVRKGKSQKKGQISKCYYFDCLYLQFDI